MHLHRSERLEDDFSNFFIGALEKTGGIDSANFQGVCMENIAAVEDIVETDIFLYDFDTVDRSMIEEREECEELL